MPIRLKRRQAALLVERVVGTLERELPIVLAGFPAIFGAADRLADMRIAREENARSRRAVGEGVDQCFGDWLVIEVPEAD